MESIGWNSVDSGEIRGPGVIGALGIIGTFGDPGDIGVEVPDGLECLQLSRTG